LLDLLDEMAGTHRSRMQLIKLVILKVKEINKKEYIEIYIKTIIGKSFCRYL
jgi:ribosomal protein L20A (L18A)